ncbi:GNAT family N-acetyltransferase [Arcicella aquatica]|uniref:GNAT family N-acetyltransferase n=1 Tax=Arcicella aquatica TaxID=217141 RepID=A0ABU5QJZ2_9BACT|nr:GNAT family N-acetyltransferase [Arcicella aquatica]MEA5257386.1 GNAT family N-acetyltransferase [Arcicella aquatica]
MQFHYVNYSPDELDEVRKIFIEYAEYLKIDLCFQDFEKELQTLSKVYAAPAGCIILAKINEEIVGCVALKPIAEGVCEMKRLYVKPIARGHKVGRKLVEELITFAKNANYQTMKLDTLTTLTEAIGLYRSFGFQATSAYVYNPLDEVLYFELSL